MNRHTTLTKELVELLISAGYQYALIKDVGLNPDTGVLYSMTLSVHREIPKQFRESCTGIDDIMITGLLDNLVSNVVIYLDNWK